MPDNLDRKFEQMYEQKDSPFSLFKDSPHHLQKTNVKSTNGQGNVEIGMTAVRSDSKFLHDASPAITQFKFSG